MCNEILEDEDEDYEDRVLKDVVKVTDEVNVTEQVQWTPRTKDVSMSIEFHMFVTSGCEQCYSDVKGRENLRYLFADYRPEDWFSPTQVFFHFFFRKCSPEQNLKSPVRCKVNRFVMVLTVV